MYFLTSNTQRLQCATDDAISLPYTALDFTTVYIVNSDRKDTTRGPVAVTGYIDNTFRNLVPAIPSEGTQYNVQSIHIVNSDNITHTLTFRLIDDGNARKLFTCTLYTGWSVAYYNEQGWCIYDNLGIKKKDSSDFYLEISKGSIPNHSRVNKSGYNADVDTTTDPEDVWDGGGIWVQPTQARVHALVSTSPNDTEAGTGARTITLQGLDANYSFQSETIILNGTTPVNTVGSYIIIDFMFINTAGSGGTNAGIITATAATDTTITAQINVNGMNQTQMAIHQVRAGHKAYINHWDCGMFQQTASSSSEVWLMTKSFGGVWRTRRVALLNNSGNSHHTDQFLPPIELTEKTLIKIQAFSVTNSSTSIESTFDLTLIKFNYI